MLTALVMKKVLVLYATREGQTEKIAIRVADHLENAGVHVHLMSASDTDKTGNIELAQYGQLVFGASMHAGGLEPEIVEFINRNQEQIESRARSFFLVLLSAATKDPALREKWLIDAQQKMTGQLHVAFDDTEMIAGALMYSRYPLPMKWLMKRIAKSAGEGTDVSKDYEYTDWDQVKRYANKLIQAARQSDA